MATKAPAKPPERATNSFLFHPPTNPAPEFIAQKLILIFRPTNRFKINDQHCFPDKVQSPVPADIPCLPSAKS
jgi:hypothetical protein